MRMLLVLSFLTTQAFVIQDDLPQFDLSKMILINEQPSLLTSEMDAPCAEASFASFSPHEDKFIEVYTDQASYDMFKNQKQPNFPAGTTIIKKKFSNYLEDKSSVELYTVMVKTKFTAVPNIANWEFKILDKDLKVFKEGNTSECANCHKQYLNSDFVTRENYFPNQWRLELK
ncbi:MAG: cytochrome P460 family protein [Flavobacteriales bacterium]|nr:cytochrome P460 family protein [Flavobacteriales bacterium]